MSLETIITVFVGVLAALFGVLIIVLRIPKKLKPDYFVSQWKELQAFCKDKTTWPKALADADKLLDRALKKRKFKGRSMGERLVAAQRTFSDNDAVWFAHNLAKKAHANNPKFRLKESDVKNALVGFRQALRDIGALPSGQSKDS